MPFPSPLLPVMSEEERRGLRYHFYEWDRITFAPIEKVSLLPENHPFVPYLPKGWMQDGRGTCTGFAGAITGQCNYYACTGDVPTAEEMAEAIANQTVQVGSCTMIYDKWYRTVISAQFAYHTGRIVGDVQYPSGGYCSAVIQAMKQIGSVAWDTVLTSRTPFCAPESYPTGYDDAVKLAEGHKLEGYAKLTTWTGIMDAIANAPAHCIMMPINVYDVPPDSMNNLRISGNPSGSHALPWLFVDYENKRIGCWNSWGTEYPQITWIDEKYWREAGGPAFVPIDSQEALFAKIIYSQVTVTANVPCQFIVNGETRPEGYVTLFSAMLAQGKETTIAAIPQDTTLTSQVRTLLFWQENETVTFTFATEPVPEKPWWKVLLEKILALFNKKTSGDDPQKSGEPAQEKGA